MVLKRKNSVELIQVLILLIALNGIETDNGYTYGGIRYGLLIALNGIETVKQDGLLNIRRPFNRT